MNPILTFIYWDMNYHVEHHMYPMVPYYALAAQHEEVKHDCPAANSGIGDTGRTRVRPWSKILLPTRGPGKGKGAVALPRPLRL